MKVLVYADGSDASLRAVERALEFAGGGADVVALHVYPPRLDRGRVSAFAIEEEDLDRLFAASVLAEVTRRFDGRGLRATTLILEGRLTEVICDYAANGGFDLLLIGSLAEPRLGPGLAEAVRRRAAVRVETVF